MAPTTSVDRLQNVSPQARVERRVMNFRDDVPDGVSHVDDLFIYVVFLSKTLLYWAIGCGCHLWRTLFIHLDDLKKEVQRFIHLDD